MGKKLGVVLLGGALALFFSVIKTNVQSSIKIEPSSKKVFKGELGLNEKIKLKEVSAESAISSSKDELKKIMVSVEGESKKTSENDFSKSYHKVHTVEFNKVSEKVSLNLVFEESDFNIKNALLVSRGGDVKPLKFSIDESVKKEFKKRENMFKDDWVSLSSKGVSLSSVQLVLLSVQKDSVIDVYVQKFKKVGNL